MLTYTSISAYNRKEKKFYEVQIVDFVNGMVKVCEKEEISIDTNRVKTINHIHDFKLEEVILFVALDIIKGSKKKKQQAQLMTLQMFNSSIKKNKKKRN